MAPRRVQGMAPRAASSAPSSSSSRKRVAPASTPSQPSKKARTTTDAPPTPATTPTKSRPSRFLRPDELAEDTPSRRTRSTSSSVAPAVRAVRASTRVVQRRAATPALSESEWDEEDEDVPITPSKRRTRASALSRAVDSDDETDMPPTPTKTPPRARTPKAKVKRPVTPAPVSDEEVSDADEIEAVLLAKPPTPASLRKKRAPVRQASPIPVASTSAAPVQLVDEEPRSFPPALVLSLLRRVNDTLHGRAPMYLPSSSEAPSGSREAVAAESCLPTLEPWEADVRAQLDRTVREGEGNCMVLIGARSVGKSAIVERSLDILAQAHGRDGFVVVRLNGMVCTSDRASLREIARQLCADAGPIDDDGSSFTSHAAILSSLLAILEPRQKATTATRPIIFVLDEFDLWTERDARQSFLYCLLDIVQSKSRASGGMCVIGLSARTDCIHLLEKRVKSRCQSRILHLLPPSSLDAFVEVGRAALRCDPAAIEGDDGEELARRWARAVDNFLALPSTRREIKAIYDLRASKTELMTRLGLLIARTAATVDSTLEAIELPAPLPPSLALVKPAASRTSLEGLTLVELAVLIAAKHLEHKARNEDKPSYNLAMLYDEYLQHQLRVSRTSKVTAREFTKPVFARAFEHLCALELIVDAGATGRAALTVSPWFRKVRIVLFIAYIDEAVEGNATVHEAMQRWSKFGETA